MFTLTDNLKNEIEIGEETYQLNLFFDVVLLFFDLMKDDTFTDGEKIEIAFEMFVGDVAIPFDKKYEVVKYITETYILEQTEVNHDGTKHVKKYYDLKQDAEFIYASFMQEYGIDLIEQQGKLHWKKFNALLNGLRDKTRFKEIVGIRASELPKGKGMEEERKRLRELKRMYALEQGEHDKEQQLNAMFNMLAGGK